MRTQKVVIVSRIVIFDEKSLWNWKPNKELHMSTHWDNSEKSRIIGVDDEFESPNQALESPSVKSTPNAVIILVKGKR